MVGLVAHAYANAPAFKSRLDAAGVVLADIRGVDDLAKIPVLSKDELVSLQQEEPPFGGYLTINAAELPRIYISPGPIFDPQPPPEDLAALLAPLHSIGIEHGDRVLNTFSYHLSPAGLLLDEALRACGATVIPSGPGNSALQIQLMLQLGATGFVGTPSYLMTLLDLAEERGIAPDSLPLGKALFTSEPYLPIQRARFEAAYGLRTCSAYGTADIGLIGYTRAGVTGFCVMQHVVLQVCAPQSGEPLPAGEIGEVVVTPLNRAYPLIRFGTGDLGALAKESQCEGQQLLGLYGRSGDAVKVRGSFLHPLQLRAALRLFPAIEALQAVITQRANRDVLTLVVALRENVPAADLLPKLQAQAAQAARLRIDDVRVVKPGSIAPEDPLILDQRSKG